MAVGDNNEQRKKVSTVATAATVATEPTAASSNDGELGDVPLNAARVAELFALGNAPEAGTEPAPGSSAEGAKRTTEDMLKDIAKNRAELARLEAEIRAGERHHYEQKTADLEAAKSLRDSVAKIREDNKGKEQGMFAGIGDALTEAIGFALNSHVEQKARILAA